jgi:hypothetical protein
MGNLFWLSDEAWAAIEPHLPSGKPGKPRVDDRGVLRPDVVGVIVSRRTVGQRRSTTATTGALVEASGADYARKLAMVSSIRGF